MLKIALRAALALAFGLPALAQAAVFVNEIHYDDSTGAGDVNESIEVVATAGEDLTQYSIVLYNGSGGATYDTDGVPTGATVTCGGAVRIAAISYATNGVQNGPPDGIALVTGASVVQFLSYEGSFTATNGPANGMVSVDIGVSETNSTAPGTSLQLGGMNGTQYSDFTWQASATATAGACNNGQTFGAGVDNPPSVVSTDPPAGAMNVSPSSNIEVVFSEPVNVTMSWYSIDCSISGSRPSSFLPVMTGTTFTIDPNDPLPNEEDCTLNLNADQITDLDGMSDQLAGDSRFTFTIGEDLPPTVASTTPVDGATGVALDTMINIKFSEDVDVFGNWYAIACTPSGAKTATVQPDSASSYTLIPDSPFAPGENCVVTLEADNILDQDGTNDNPTADYAFDFTTVADNAPDVQSFVPANGANNVQLDANVVVTFTEAVNVSGAWFTINCSLSGAHPAMSTPAAGPATTFTLNPNANFVNMDSCTVTIESTLVLDVDGTATQMAMDRSATFTASDYYGTVNASSCTALRTTLHALIDDHTAYPYSISGLPPAAQRDTWDVLETADQNPLVSTEILEVYENAHYAKVGAGNSNYNREHTWPNSYGFNNLDQNTGSAPNVVPQSSAYTDTHMLYLSDIEYNANRGSKPYATCPTCTMADATLAYNGQGGGPVVYPGNHNWKTTSGTEPNGSYEVWNARRGDMARAVLYMDIRYEGGQATAGNTNGQFEPQLIVTDDRGLISSSASTGSTSSSTTAYMGLKTDMIAWHNADPPNAQEVLRNDVIFSFQGNRNPFIDHPEWVAIAFQTPCNPGSTMSTTALSSSPDPSTFGQSVTLTATVSGGAGTPTGTVTFLDGGNTLDTITLNGSGVATLSTSTLTVGSHSLTAQYSGNGTYATSLGSDTQTVNGAGNTNPTVTSPGNQNILEDGATTVLTVTVNDVETAAAALVLSASSNNTTLVPNANIALGGSGASRTVQVTPVANLSGTATITLTVTDANSATGTATFMVTVTAVNDAPSFTVLGNRQHVSGTTGVQTVSGFVTGTNFGPGEGSQAVLAYAAAEQSDPSNVISAVAIANDGTLTYTLTGAAGTATVMATLRDNGGTVNGGVDTSAPVTFSIVVSTDAIFANGFEN